ncbi:MAG: hypothetical protein KJI69_06540 [Patescibacteria group bacterium]|nr:hypothetical protein [Patescibacteria group bacterium]
MNTDVYLEISQEGFLKFKKDAIEESKANLGEDYGDEACYKDMTVTDAEYEFDEKTGKINLYGSLYKEGTKMGYISFDSEVDLDLALEIVNYYMKKLGKLKTVLEATG